MRGVLLSLVLMAGVALAAPRPAPAAPQSLRTDSGTFATAWCPTRVRGGAMPQDLFGDVVVRRSSNRSRRSSVAVISVIAHAAALVALMIVPLVATDVLPVPR